MTGCQWFGLLMRVLGVRLGGMNVRVRNGADVGRNFGEEMCLQSREECQLLARSGRGFTLNFDPASAGREHVAYDPIGS